ncbi:MAG: outer membrane protein assembly factor BamB family protein [Planctomycetota bacterium]
MILGAGSTATCLARDEGVDPWPFWGRTPTRVGNTTTVGPQTPRIEWSIQISDFPFEEILESSPVMDSAGRVVLGHPAGVTVVDSIARERLWIFTDGDIPRGVAVWGGRVLWGDVPPFSKLYCYDIASGEEMWTFQASRGFSDSAPVVDPDGVVYMVDEFANAYARRVEDGGEVWTVSGGARVRNAPSLQWPTLLTTGSGPMAFDLAGLDPVTGEVLWTFETAREIRGIHAIHGDRVYMASSDRWLYCLDAGTGEEIWRFWTEQFNRGAVAIGHDGTVYTGAGGNEGILFAVSPDGEEIWRYPVEEGLLNAPIVGGDGTIYVCATHWTGQIYEGYVYAVRPDGTTLWIKPMPDNVSASPMLAPDGTLYVVCRDKYMYAFKDAEVLGDLSGDGIVGIADLLMLLAGWGPCPDLPTTCPIDLDLDGVVGLRDLLILLASWD